MHMLIFMPGQFYHNAGQAGPTVQLLWQGGPKRNNSAVDVMFSRQAADVIALLKSCLSGLMEKYVESCPGGHWFDSWGRARVLDRDCKTLLSSEQGDSRARILGDTGGFGSKSGRAEQKTAKMHIRISASTSVSPPVSYFPQRCS